MTTVRTSRALLTDMFGGLCLDLSQEYGSRSRSSIRAHIPALVYRLRCTQTHACRDVRLSVSVRCDWGCGAKKCLQQPANNLAHSRAGLKQLELNDNGTIKHTVLLYCIL